MPEIGKQRGHLMVKRIQGYYCFDGSLTGWIVKTAKKNYWRVAAWIYLEDLIQEGFLAYAICNHRYREKVQNRRHFMALVQVVFMQRITDLANLRTRGEDVSISQIAAAGKESTALEFLAGGFESDCEVNAAIATAPYEVRILMNLLQNDRFLDALQKPLRRRKDGSRETTSERLSRWLGIDYVDFEALLREVLGVKL